MFIKQIELYNFKCHTQSKYQFGKVNHFFGDNFTGKSSISEAIIFCLFGVTKHGYKTYVKEFLQESKTTMTVGMDIIIDGEDYLITRTMNARGHVKASINNVPATEKDFQEILGYYKTFIYSFLPEIFPEESNSNARAFIIEHLIQEKDSFNTLEIEKRKITEKQKEIKSSITFFQGQKSLLTKQINSTLFNHFESSTKLSKPTIRKEQLDTLNKQLHDSIEVKSQLEVQIKSLHNELNDVEDSALSNIEHCPTCNQEIPDTLLTNLQEIHNVQKQKLKDEINSLQIELEVEIREIQTLSSTKSKHEKELRELNNEHPPRSTNQTRGVQEAELMNVNKKLEELKAKKALVVVDLKRVKHQLGETANEYQDQINQHFEYTRINLFKLLKSGELRPDFQIMYKNRPYRVLSYSEKIRCMLEIIALINKGKRKYPIFLDNLESITQIVQPDTQIFSATVKKGIVLTLKVRE